MDQLTGMCYFTHNTSRYMMKYDSDGSYIQIKDGKVITREITTYNDEGKHLEWISYENDGSIREIRTWQFNKNKLITRWSYLNPDRSVKYIETSRYDDFGNRLEHVGREYREVNEYNKDNKRVVHRFYGKDGSLSFQRFYTYDERGNMILEEVIEKERAFFLKYTYDENNLPIEGIDSLSNHKTVSTYDDQHRLFNEKTYDGSGTLISNCFYEYDEYGECIGERYEE